MASVVRPSPAATVKLTSVEPAIEVVFIDTGYHFPETLAYRDELVARFGFPIPAT